MFKLAWTLTPLILKLLQTELTLVDDCEQKYSQTLSYLFRRDEGSKIFFLNSQQNLLFNSSYGNNNLTRAENRQGKYQPPIPFLDCFTCTDSIRICK